MNRRIRNRTYGGVGEGRREVPPYPMPPPLSEQGEECAGKGAKAQGATERHTDQKVEGSPPLWASASGQDHHGRWAEITVPPSRGNPVVQRLRWIEPGTFRMGSPETEAVMVYERLDVLIPLFSAWFVGSLIGLERSFHGRPAGFRTHALVCLASSLASSLLMSLTIHQQEWLHVLPPETLRADPTRMAQGIMTGIGFLGAGVIFKEGLSVRGLTTAASIWMTAAVGILFGVGLDFPAIVASLTTIGTLSLFRWVEHRMPTELYAQHYVGFARGAVIPEKIYAQIIREHGFTIANLSYRLSEEGRLFEYRMILRTTDRENLGRLAQTLQGMESILGFRISPTGD